MAINETLIIKAELDARKAQQDIQRLERLKPKVLVTPVLDKNAIDKIKLTVDVTVNANDINRQLKDLKGKISILPQLDLNDIQRQLSSRRFKIS